MIMKTYLDNAATTRVAGTVMDIIKEYSTEKFGNASSLYSLGKESREAIEYSRKICADFLKCKPSEIVFTSGGTESNNLALKGLMKEPGRNHIIVSAIEHPSVLEPARSLEKQGFRVSVVDVDKDGIIKLDQLRGKIGKDTLLVSVMHVNNETGVIQPIEEIAALCKEKGAFFHIDAVQSFGKIPLDVRKIGCDLLSASGHKIHGPKGVGLLFIREGVRLKPLFDGGGHELGRRSGTENVPGIAGLGEAVDLCEEWMHDLSKYQKLQVKLIDGLKNYGKLNGSQEKRIWSNVHMSFPVEADSLVMLLDRDGIAVSTGSACSTLDKKQSHVLKALGLPEKDIKGAIRITLSYDTQEENIDYALEKIKKCVDLLRMRS